MLALDLPEIATLNSQISAMEAETQRLTKERAKIAAHYRIAVCHDLYLRLARRIRAPQKTFDGWPIVVWSIGPLTIGVLAFVAVNEIIGGWWTAISSAIGGAAVSATLLALLLYLPKEERLASGLADAQINRSIERSRLSDANSQLASAKRQLQGFLEARRQLIVSGKLQRASLLQRNWKAMRDDEWEDFLVEVCRTHGAKVQRTGRAGDQGVDLIVEIGARRIAVQAKGYYHAVNNAAVQEAVAGVAHHQCNACAVITNSRFTKGATELAMSNRCTLIGEDEFPDFVLGKIAL